MIKIVSYKLCPFVQRVTAALTAKNIVFEVEFISLKNKPQWFLALSPNGQVPIMVTESGATLFESDAIVEYIEDEYGALENDISNEQRALDRAWSYLGSKNYLVQCSAMRSNDEKAFTERSEKLITAFEKMEKQLANDSTFYKSDRLSNIDIAWLPLLHRANIVKQHTGFDFLAGLPKIQAWQNRLLATGIAEKTVSEDFEQLFIEFYLTSTHLSNVQNIQKSEGCCASRSCC